MNLSLSLNPISSSVPKSKPLMQSKQFRIGLIAIGIFFTAFAFAGGDDGALGDIWAYMNEALTGAPGKILSAAMLFSAVYNSIVKPNPALAVVSFVMMLILANGEKIISGFLDAGIPL